MEAGGHIRQPLGAFFRRLATRVGKAKALTATARKIATVLYSTMRQPMPLRTDAALAALFVAVARLGAKTTYDAGRRWNGPPALAK